VLSCDVEPESLLCGGRYVRWQSIWFRTRCPAMQMVSQLKTQRDRSAAFGAKSAD
jgi:hypothetical protein